MYNESIAVVTFETLVGDGMAWKAARRVVEKDCSDDERDTLANYIDDMLNEEDSWLVRVIREQTPPIEAKPASRFDEEFKHMVEMTEALKQIAAAAKERNMWLVIKVATSYNGDKLVKIRIDDIKEIEDWDNGDVSLFGINDSPLDEDYGCQTVFTREQWSTRRIMTTAEVLGL